MTNNQAWMVIIIILVIAFIITKGESIPTPPIIPESNLSLIKAQLAHEIAYEHEKSKLKVEGTPVSLDIPELDLDYVYNASEIKEITASGTQENGSYEETIVGPGCTPETKESCLICKADEKILIEAPDIESTLCTEKPSVVGDKTFVTTSYKTYCSYGSCISGFCRWRPLARIQAWRDRNRERRRNTFTYMRAR